MTNSETNDDISESQADDGFASENQDHPEMEYYGDPKITSLDAKVPLFLKLTYIIFPIWGIFTFYFFWNGSAGWFDRGYWKELQVAANTTFPIENQNMNKENIKEIEPKEKSEMNNTTQ